MKTIAIYSDGSNYWKYTTEKDSETDQEHADVRRFYSVQPFEVEIELEENPFLKITRLAF